MTTRSQTQVRVLAPVLWLMAIWGMSSIPSNDFNPPGIIGFDKLAHIGVYGILSLLVNRALKAKKASPAVYCLMYALLLLNALLDEYHQKLIPGRSVSVWDFAANSMGLLAGFILRWITRDRGK